MKEKLSKLSKIFEFEIGKGKASQLGVLFSQEKCTPHMKFVKFQGSTFSQEGLLISWVNSTGEYLFPGEYFSTVTPAKNQRDLFS